MFHIDAKKAIIVKWNLNQHFGKQHRENYLVKNENGNKRCARRIRPENLIINFGTLPRSG